MLNILLILLIGHFLGDYYFQSENMAIKKERSILFLLIHMFIVLSVNIVIYVLSNYQTQMLVLLSIVTVGHVFIDTLKYIFNNKFKKFSDKTKLIYIVDQTLHLLVIIIAYVVFKDKISFNYFYGADFLISKNILSILLSFIIIGKPTNVSFSVIFKDLKPLDSTNNEKDDINVKSEDILENVNVLRLDKDIKPLENFKNERYNKETKNIGRIIGTLERIIVLTLFLINAISSVGLIIAAKTLTRYNKIIKDEGFAEYYLLGTLFSLATTFIIIFLFLK